MADTVDPEQWASRKRLYYGLFFLGAFMLAAAVVLTFPALQFEFEQGASGAPTAEQVDYEYLTPQEQRVVDGALDGETQVLETSQPVPGTPGYPLEPEQIVVTKDGTAYTFTYRIVFPATEPMGLAVIGLAVGGVLAIVESIRRYHFTR